MDATENIPAIRQVIAEARAATHAQCKVMLMALKCVRGELLVQIESLRASRLDALVQWLEAEASNYAAIISVLENCAIAALQATQREMQAAGEVAHAG